MRTCLAFLAFTLAFLAASTPALAEDDGFGRRWPEAGGWGLAWQDDRPEAPSPSATGTPVAQSANEGTARLPVPATSPDSTAPAPQQAVPAHEQTEPGSAGPDGQAEANPPRSKGSKNGKSRKKKNAANPDEPVQLTADQIVHDRELGVVTAKGQVEIVQGGRTLRADTVSYNLKQDIMSAAGNVVLLEPSGDVTFTEFFELTGDFKNGAAQEIRLITADHSRLAAASATRVGGTRTDFDKAVYTPCEPCREKPDATPLWQAKANRVTHNQPEQLVEYRDVWIEVEGVPLAYSPYLSHPDPTVKRRSGFLTPTVGNNSTLGASVTTPYYFVLDDNQDLTVSPRWLLGNGTTTSTNFNSDRNASTEVLRHVVMAGQHRWIGRDGEAEAIGSFTADQTTGDLRGGVYAKGVYNIDTRWRAGYDVQRQSDDTYALVYGFRMPADRPWLTSRAYIEGFGRRDYTVTEAFAYQGLTETDDSQSQAPLVLPHMNYQHISMPGKYGGYWQVDEDALAYRRDNGTSARRLSNQVAYTLPYTSPLGDVYNLTTSVRGDGYSADDVPGEGSTVAGRAVPTMALNWRYPFINSSQTLPQVITPMGMVAVSPVGGNSPRIPNEDSVDFELDDTNVFRPNRLPGLDRVETGVRGAYGLRWAGYPYRGGSLTAQFAQAWRGHADDTFSQGSGFGENFSDYVGRVGFRPSGNLAFWDRFRLDRDTFSVERNEATVSAGPTALNASVSYGFFEKSTPDATTVFPRRHYITINTTAALTRYWSANAYTTQDITNDGQNLGWGGYLMYNDECFATIIRATRNYTSDRDFVSGYSFTLNLVFKTFGQVPVGTF